MEAEPAKDSLVLGPNGVGALRLGMSHEEMVATDSAQALRGSRHDGWPPGCRVLQYRPERFGRVPDDRLHGAISSRQGLEILYATRRMITPNGVRIGSTLVEVGAAYERPDLIPGDLLTVRASRRAVYRIYLSDAVISMSLELRHLDCTR